MKSEHIPEATNPARARHAELTSARLAVNDWHACATQEELERWRQAQQRLIAAAVAVGRSEAEARVETLETALREIVQLNASITSAGIAFGIAEAALAEDET